MNNVYELTVAFGHVTEFNEKYRDWSGDTHTKEVGITESIVTKNLSWGDVAKALEGFFPHGTSLQDIEYDLKDKVSYGYDWKGSFTVVEDAKGYPDEDGKFIVDYDYFIRPVDNLVDLTKLR